jgi:UDP-N-acetylmuramate--alanine ligase
MRSTPKDIGLVHFVGIGGIGMSGIAEVLHAMGYAVQGSDLAAGPNVVRLRDKGIEVFTGHRAAHIEKASVVVISSAIPPENPELIAARQNRIPVVRRAEMLAELMRLKRAIAVGGTHGKTTTTSMIGALLEEGGRDPTVINGGIVNQYGTNTRLGKSEWMVVEADESDGTFSRLPSTVAVVTNIDPEHMDHYGDFEDVKDAYRGFLDNLPFYGFAVLCSDHPEVQTLCADLTDRRFVTYGFNPQADVRAVNLRPKGSGSHFDVMFDDETRMDDVYLSMPGEHNVQNALAAIAIGYELKVPHAHMKKALAHFGGVKRRFTKTGEVNNITIIDDYGHHPVEIEAVLKTARIAADEKGGRVIAVMQPHRYSRLKALFDDFCTCFNLANTVIIADVYPGGEQAIEGASKEMLAQGIQDCGHRDVKILDNAQNLPQLIAEIAHQGDFVICLGAGDITKWAQDLPDQLSHILKDGAANTKARAS